MNPHEIYLARFPFGDVATLKLRPVLLLTGEVGSVPEVLVAYISSVIPATVLPSNLLLDLVRPEHASTGLKVPSLVRLHKLATIHKKSIMRHLGKLEPAVITMVQDKLKVLLGLSVVIFPRVPPCSRRCNN